MRIKHFNTPPTPPFSVPYTAPVSCPLPLSTIAAPAVLHHSPHPVSTPNSLQPDRYQPLASYHPELYPPSPLSEPTHHPTIGFPDRQPEYIMSEPYTVHDTAVPPPSFYGGYTNTQSEYQQPRTAAPAADQFSLQALPTHPSTAVPLHAHSNPDSGWDPPYSNNQQQLVQAGPPTCWEPDPPDGTPLYAAAEPPCHPYQPPPPPEELYPPPEDRPSRSLSLPDRTLHPPSWLPSYSQPAAAAIQQPPQLHSSSSWVDMPQQQVQNSVPTFTASTISLTATSQDRSYHEYPVVVRQPLLLHLTSPSCSAVMPSVAAAVSVLLKEAQYLSGEEVGVIVASPHKEVREAKSVVNLGELFTNFANGVIYRVALGRKYDDGEEFKNTLDEFGVLLDSFDMSGFVPWLCWIMFGMSGIVRGVARNIDEFLEFVVREYIGDRGERKKDLVDLLREALRTKRGGFVLDDISIKALILDMFTARSDTTFTLIEWTWSELIRHNAKNEFFFTVDVLILRQLCASHRHLHTFDPGGDTSPKLLFATLFVLSCFHLEDKVNFNRGGVDTSIS